MALAQLNNNNNNNRQQQQEGTSEVVLMAPCHEPLSKTEQKEIRSDRIHRHWVVRKRCNKNSTPIVNMPPPPTEEDPYNQLPGLMDCTTNDDSDDGSSSVHSLTTTNSLITTKEVDQEIRDGSTSVHSPTTTNSLIVAREVDQEIREEVMIQKIIEQALFDTRTPPGMSRPQYHTGLNDLVAVLVMNTQRASKAAEVLAAYNWTHLRTDLLASRIRTIFDRTMGEIDKELKDHLEQNNIDAVEMLLPWVQSWFCHHVTNLAVASRLVDFFLASDPDAPIVLALCLIALPEAREELLSARGEGRVRWRFGRVLTKLEQDRSRRMALFECAIQQAITKLTMNPSRTTAPATPAPEKPATPATPTTPTTLTTTPPLSMSIPTSPETLLFWGSVLVGIIPFVLIILALLHIGDETELVGAVFSISKLMGHLGTSMFFNSCLVGM